MKLNKFIIVFAVFGIVFLAIPTISVSYADTQITYTSAQISWPAIRTATKYNIYYKEHGVDHWQYAIIRLEIPRTGNMMSYTINDLKKGVIYDYLVGAIKMKKEMVFYKGQITVK